MKIDDIYHFFQNPPPIFLNQELTICYVSAVLIENESYGTELIQKLANEHPSFRLSDTVLYSALKFLEDEQIIKSYWKKVEGRGRPRRMYQIISEAKGTAEDLAHLWREYIAQQSHSPSVE